MEKTKNNSLIFFLRLNRFVFLILILWVAGTSCKTSKNTVSGELRDRNPEFLLKKMALNQVDAQWLSGKARITVEGEQSLTFSGNLRFRKDSLIWLNVRKLGIEVARLQFDPDSVYVIDRINKQYAVKDYASLEKLMLLPNVPGMHLNFTVLQNLLLGNPQLFPVERLSADTRAQAYRILGQNKQLNSEYWLDSNAYLLMKMIFYDLTTGNSLTVGLEDYQMVDEKRKLAFFRSFCFKNGQEDPMCIQIKLIDVEIDTPKNIRFDIPSQYSKAG